MLGPQPLPPPAQEPNHSLSGDGPPRPLMRLPAQDQPPGVRGSSHQPGGTPPPRPVSFPGCSLVRTPEPHPQLGCPPPTPPPPLPNERHGGAEPSPRESPLLCTARPLRCRAWWTVAAEAPPPASGPCSQALPPTPFRSRASSGPPARGRELCPPRLNQDPAHSRQPTPGRISETSSISHPAASPALPLGWDDPQVGACEVQADTALGRGRGTILHVLASWCWAPRYLGRSEALLPPSPTLLVSPGPA